MEEAHGLAGAGLDRATAVVLDALTDRPDQTRDQPAASPRVHRLELDGQTLILLLALSAGRAQLQRSVA
jgi:hypothetical protein